MLSLKSIFPFIISPCLSPSSPRPIPLALSSVTLSCPCSSVPFAHAVAFLYPLSSSPCHHFPPLLPHLTYSHSLQLKDPILLELCCLYALNTFLTSFWLSPSSFLQPVPPSQSSIWHQLLSALTSSPGTSEEGETPAPPSAPLNAYCLWSSQPPSTLLPPTSHGRRAHWQLSWWAGSSVCSQQLGWKELMAALNALPGNPQTWIRPGSKWKIRVSQAITLGQLLCTTVKDLLLSGKRVSASSRSFWTVFRGIISSEILRNTWRGEVNGAEGSKPNGYLNEPQWGGAEGITGQWEKGDCVPCRALHESWWLTGCQKWGHCC